MSERDFIYWLQGALEIMDPKQLDEKQIQVIKDHIALVLKKETPTRIGQFVIKEDPSLQPEEIKVVPQSPLLGDLLKRSPIKCANAGIIGRCNNTFCQICNPLGGRITC